MDYTKVEVYRCNYCMDYHTYEESNIKEHIEHCLANPKNKACMMCKNIKRYNGIVDGRPDSLFKCEKLDKILEQVDMQLTGAECFEERGHQQIDHVNSPEYNEYMENLTKKIKNEMS